MLWGGKYCSGENLLWGISLLWGVICSGEAMLLWGENLLWGVALGRQCCSGEAEVALGCYSGGCSGVLLWGVALGRCQLLWGGNVALGRCQLLWGRCQLLWGVKCCSGE
ncbi:MAG TPA: hypothetical protein PLB63_08990 [Planctomycetota bacterium]|nr:hypothetical protein [Planctomycetota bacterium]